MENYPQNTNRRLTPIINQIPDNIDFGYCSISEETTNQFTLKNTNEKSNIKFNFSDCFFKIFPKSGIIPPGDSITIRISSSHTKAKSIISTSLFTIEKESKKIIKISAIFKFPHIMIKNTQINIGQAFMGQTIEKTEELFNPLEIPAIFQIIRKDESLEEDEAITCFPVHGKILPGKSVNIVFSFNPQIAGYKSLTQFIIKCKGGTDQIIETTGLSIPIVGEISANFFDFGALKSGTWITKELLLRNKTNVQMNYEFVKIGGCFSAEPNQGQIEGHGLKRIKVKFCPLFAGKYFQRVYCVIHEQDLLQIVLIGTSFDFFIKKNSCKIISSEEQISLKNQFLLMNSEPGKKDSSKTDKIHFSNQNSEESQLKSSIQTARPQVSFKKNNSKLTPIMRGSSRNQNNAIMEVPKSVKIPLKLKTQLFLNFQSKSSKRLLQESRFSDSKSNEEKQPDKIIDVVSQFMNEVHCLNEFFKVDSQTIEFENDPQNPTEVLCKEVLITNISNNQILYFKCHFVGISIEISEKEFSLNPLDEKIIFFKTTKSDLNKFGSWKLFYVVTNQLENCLINNNKNTSRLIENEKPEYLMADMMIALNIQTDINLLKSFMNNLEITPSRKSFVLMSKVGESSFITMLLHNKSDYPSEFSFSKLKNNEFSIFPKKGIICKKSHSIIVIRFFSEKWKIIEEFIKLTINKTISRVIRLKGICSNTKIILQNDGHVFFFPAHVGVEQSQTFLIQNRSKYSSEFFISIPENFQKELSLSPQSFSLAEYQSTLITINFAPYYKREYTIKCPIQLKQKGTFDETIKDVITVCGRGRNGRIKIEPVMIDLSEVIVNFTEKRTFVVKNLSDVHFNISLHLNVSTSSNLKKERLLSFFEMDFSEKILPARTEMTFNLKFTPREICEAVVSLIVFTKPNVVIGTTNNIDFSHIIKSTLIENQPMKFQNSKVTCRVEHSSSEKSPIHRTNLQNLRLNEELCNLELEKFIILSKKSMRQKAEAEITVKVIYPSLKIVDIRCDELSVASMWGKFQISQINKEFLQPITNFELKHTLSYEKLFDERISNSASNRKFEWDFGYLHYNETEKKFRVVKLTIQNLSSSDLHWFFKNKKEIVYENDCLADTLRICEQQGKNSDKYSELTIDQDYPYSIKPK